MHKSGYKIPMKGIKNFILGFSLSLVSVAIIGQLSSSAPHSQNISYPSEVKIDLFKDSSHGKLVYTPEVKSNIQKISLVKNNTKSISLPQEEVQISELDLTQPIQESDESEVIFSYDDVEGIDDEEVLAVNIEKDIPIEFDSSSETNLHAEIAHSAEDEQVAMLPTVFANSEENYENNSFDDSPWVIAKGNKHVNNKKLVEKFAKDTSENFDITNLDQTKSAQIDKEISYQVAEKIKQSIIFPIPDEILNDENLVPTFISNKSNSESKAKTSEKKIPTPKKEKAPIILDVAGEEMKILPKEEIKDNKDEGNILSKVSSWFKENTTQQAESSKRSNKKAVSYSSQDIVQPVAQEQSHNEVEDLVSFYETLQETEEEHEQRGIIPTELKLSFQSNKAEISGQTLHWLKAFSEKAKDDNIYLQVRLDASAPVALQRKRLNLLYTIFINNGVDFKKVDTVFSLTEQNAFIIRTLKIK